MYKDAIVSSRLTDDDTARKVFLIYPTFAFKDNYTIAFNIFKEIADNFVIPITSIQVVGSSKIGYSHHKQTEFSSVESDLDIAIINQELFIWYSEVALNVSNGYQDQTGFKDTSAFLRYKNYLSRGIFRPDLMPNCDAKSEWFKFFNKLSNNYIKTFKAINAGIYLSETFFAFKQSKLISDIKNDQK